MGELKLELRMTQQTLWVYPAVEDVRQQLLQKLFAWQAIATSHPRIQSSRYQVPTFTFLKHLNVEPN